MSEVLLLRLEAPLLSFGGPMVDRHGVGQAFPAASLIVGLIGNALGYEHADSARLQRLQTRVQYGVRADRPGEPLMDFQTIDLSQDFLADGWTTRGAVEGRAGGNSEGTHIREREYIADGVYTVALTLEPADETPTLDQIAKTLDEPERPLFIGRKPCLPSTRVLLGKVAAESVLEALEHAPRDDRSIDGKLLAWWPAASEAHEQGSRIVPVSDERDWRNQIHVGRRLLREGLIAAEGAPRGA